MVCKAAFAAALAAIASTGFVAHAGVIYETGFENPPFTMGPINGQNGWFVFSASGQTSDPVIENTLVKSGTQAVSVDGSVTGQTGPVYAPNLTLPNLRLSADVYIGSSGSESSWQFATTGVGGIGFAGGIDIYGTSIIGITASYPTIGTITRDGIM